MSRKREKPYPASRPIPFSFPKRRRPLPPVSDDTSASSTSSPAAVLVIGLPTACSVLDLKSRFEIYGPISRTRIDPHGVGFLTFRSESAAESAVSASLDPSFGITFDSQRVQVVLASDPKSRGEDRFGSDGEQNRHTSKLLRASPPLRIHRRGGNRLSSTVVSSSSIDGGIDTSSSRKSSRLDAAPFKGRELVAYDDLL